MSVYRLDDERAMRVQRLVDDWMRSGLLAPEQRDQIVPGLKVDLRRTNRFLRATLCVFALMIVWAFAGLVAVFLDLRGPLPTWMSLVAAVACFSAAQEAIVRYRFYRFGIEEGLAVAAASFFVVFAATVVSTPLATIVAFSAATLAAAGLFLRFGFAYAGVAAVLCAPLVIFDLDQSDTVRRVVAFTLMMALFVVARRRRLEYEPDHPADTYGILGAVSWAAMYVMANLKISGWLSAPDEYAALYWSTYGLIWVIPAAGLWLAVRDRDRALLDVNILAWLATLLTNKAYLGAEPKPWDPVLFGVLLIGVAMGLKRWLASGPEGGRAGFTPRRLVASERDRLAMAGHASILAPGMQPADGHPADPSSIGSGGRSGGAGASGQF